MTDRVNKTQLRRTLSLSKSKKKRSDDAGISASPITSFFSSQPPSKLACPLCGQPVPRFRINEHIDLQCQNFDRGDSSAASASNSVVPSMEVSARGKPSKSPELGQKKETGVKETSPYFKKHKFPQPQRETAVFQDNKTVVRTIDLGSLCSKLSRRCHKEPERTQTDDECALACAEAERESGDTPSSSQKENVLVQSFQDNKDCVTVVDLIEASGETLTTDLSSSDKASKSETIQRAPSSKLSPSSKLAKRKKTTTSARKVSGFRKKAKCEGSSGDPEEMLSTESIVEKADTDEPKTKVPSSTLSETPSEHAAGSSPPLWLPYYLQNFRTVLRAVLENEDDRGLFNQEDMSLVDAFEKLSGMPQVASLNFGNFANEIRPNFLYSMCCLSQSHGAEAVREALPEEAEVASSKQTGIWGDL